VSCTPANANQTPMHIHPNQCDSHVPWTHHKSISNRNVVGDYVTTLTEPVTASGFAGVWQTGPR